MKLAKQIILTASVAVSANGWAATDFIDMPDFYTHADDPVLMIVGTDELGYDTITRGEFEYMYNKNNSISLDGPMSVDAYKELFINYKMKAHEAKKKAPDLKLGFFRKEMDTYTKQLAFPYLVNAELEDEYIKEAYRREQEIVSASHILIKGSTDASRKKILEIYGKLQKGEKFFDLAKKYSECGSASRGGYLGEFSAFQMVYDFETEAYNTPVGEYSKPFETQFGYHIVYVHDRRPNVTKAKAQEIYMSQNASVAHVDSVLALAKKAKKFSKVAVKYSERSDVKKTKGDMGWISDNGLYPTEIAKKILSIPVGDVQKFNSMMGYHIFTVTDIETGVPLDSTHYNILKQKVMNGDRYEALKRRVATDTRARHGFSLNENVVNQLSQFSKVDPNLLYDSIKKIDEPLYYLNGDAVTMEMYLPTYRNFQISYLQKVEQNFFKTSIAIDPSLSYKDNFLINLYSVIDDEIYSSEIAKIGKEHPEFGYAIKEYSDGLLVYAISEKNLWDPKANSADSLEAFFQSRKDQYKMNEKKWVGSILSFKDKDTLIKVDKWIKKNNIKPYKLQNRLKKEILSKKAIVSGQESAWKAGENKILDKYYFKTIPADSVVELKSHPYVLLVGEETDIPMRHENIRGKVVADYQKYKEDVWIEKLRAKRKVIIKEDVYKTVNNH
ncbi:MAG: peptidylprolyl isomerase [Paludibacteraceae bacterium]|nr:peptidylprolyl isomerase [Paludibacteraceae bacterium]